MREVVSSKGVHELTCGEPSIPQLLWLMNLLSKHEKHIKNPIRNTRNANRVNFKVPAKITHIYEHSPYYIGTKLWDILPEATQKSDNIIIHIQERNGQTL